MKERNLIDQSAVNTRVKQIVDRLNEAAVTYGRMITAEHEAASKVSIIENQFRTADKTQQIGLVSGLDNAKKNMENARKALESAEALKNKFESELINYRNELLNRISGEVNPTSSYPEAPTIPAPAAEKILTPQAPDIISTILETRQQAPAAEKTPTPQAPAAEKTPTPQQTYTSSTLLTDMSKNKELLTKALEDIKLTLSGIMLDSERRVKDLEELKKKKIDMLSNMTSS